MFVLRIKFAVFMLVLALVISCDSDEEMPAATGDPIGLISYEEFMASTPPTYQGYLDAYEAVTQTDSTLTTDEEKLARSIFDYVATHNNSSSNGRYKASVFDMASRLSRAEWKVVLTNPYDAYQSLPTIGTSLAAARLGYPCDADNNFDGGKADALRHSFWNALMTKRSNAEFAEEMGTAHESESADERSTTMDLHNNKFGRDLVEKFPDATDEQLLELLLEERYIYVAEGEPFPQNESALMYIKGQREYDVALTGTFTNPDSGGPWEIDLFLQQCDKELHGVFELYRDEEYMARRFSGTIGDDGQLTLDVSEPFEFENPRNLRPCSNMEISLDGEPSSLSGSWTSSNCWRGGVVELTAIE